MMKELLGHSLIYTVSAVFTRGAQMALLLLLPLLLTPTDYGAFALIVTVGLLAQTVVPLEISQALARFYPAAEPRDKALYASTALWFTVMAVCLVAALALLLAGPLARLFLEHARYSSAIRYGTLFVALNTIFYFLQNQFRWQFDVRGYAIISIVFALSTFAGATSFAILYKVPVDGVLIGMGGGALIATAAGFVRLRRSFHASIDSLKLKEMLRFSLPIVPANAALFASVYGSRLILNAEASLGDVGLFTYASQIAAVASLVVLGINAALTPIIMAHYKEPQMPAMLARLFELFVAVALLISLGLGLFAREFIRFFGDPAYAPSAPLVMILAPAVLISQSYIFAPGFAIRKKTTLQLWVSLASGAFSIAANFALIPLLGIAGAAWATLVAAIAFAVGWFMLSQRLYPVPFKSARIMAAAALGAVVATAGPFGAPAELVLGVGFKLMLLAVAAAGFLALGLIPAGAAAQLRAHFLDFRRARL